MSEQTRKQRVQAAIDRGDVQELLKLVNYDPCACVGCQNEEPLCPCKMSRSEVCAAVSAYGLINGKLIRLKNK